VAKKAQPEVNEIHKVDKSVVEKGGYSSSNRTAAELPVPPQNVMRRVTDADRGTGTERAAVASDQQQSASSNSE